MTASNPTPCNKYYENWQSNDNLSSFRCSLYNRRVYVSFDSPRCVQETLHIQHHNRNHNKDILDLSIEDDRVLPLLVTNDYSLTLR